MYFTAPNRKQNCFINYSADPTYPVSRCQCSIRYLVREARICTLHDVRLACFYTDVSMLTRYSIPAVSLFPLATPDFRKVLAWYKHLTKRLPIPPLSHSDVNVLSGT